MGNEDRALPGVADLDSSPSEANFEFGTSMTDPADIDQASLSISREDPASWWTVGRDIGMLVVCFALVKFKPSEAPFNCRINLFKECSVQGKRCP